MYPTVVPNPEKSNKMASAKITWVIIQWCIGWPITIISVFGKWAVFLGVPKENIFQLSEPYQSIVSTLAIIFLITKIAISIEGWREKHIANNEKAYQLRKRHLRDIQAEMNEEEI